MRQRKWLFLLYLAPNAAHRIVACYHDGSGYQHTTIYRAPFGYSFVRAPQPNSLDEKVLTGISSSLCEVPSLMASCCWRVAAEARLEQRFRSSIASAEVQKKFDNVKNLSALWKLSHAPTSFDFHSTAPSSRFVAFPTLSYLVQRNVSFLAHGVPCTPEGAAVRM